MGKNGQSQSGSSGDKDYDIFKEDPQTVKDVASGSKDN